MKIYLAGRYDDIMLLRDVAFLLMQSGHIVTSRWLHGATPAPILPEELQKVAEEDLADIREADCFVLYSHTGLPLPTRQGHSVELGYAMAWTLDSKVYLVGERTDNVFHYAPRVVHLPAWQDLFDLLRVHGQLLQGGPHATPKIL